MFACLLEGGGMREEIVLVKNKTVRTNREMSITDKTYYVQ